MAVAKGDFSECRELAQKFLETAEWCVGDGFDDVMRNRYPLVVNATFSCEAFMKAIMIHDSKNNEFQTGHDLKMLYGQIGEMAQKWLAQKFSEEFSPKSIEQLLEEEKDDFENWRYAFEDRKNGLVSNALALMTIARNLNEYVSNLEVAQ